MGQSSHQFQIFVKPAGAECNLHCKYCYYLDKKALKQNGDLKIMSDEVLERYIIQHIDSWMGENIFFSWHGGEPLLAGPDFYRKAVALQEKYKPSGCKIVNGIQTNATLLNEEWCSFLAENNFYTGVSVDGPKTLHDKLRTYESGAGSFDRVMEKFRLLKKFKVKTEILCVVSAANVSFPAEVYNFLKETETEYLTFIPLVQRDLSSESGVSRISVNPYWFGSFLKTVFDIWVAKDIGKVKIQIIEEATRVAFNQDHTLCIFKKRCGGVPVIEVNGDFYPCDHFVNSGNLIGNIRDTHLSELLDSERQTIFGSTKENTLPQYCKDCEVIDMCNGECPKNRFINTPTGEPGLNYLCEGYKSFFTHVRPFTDSVRAQWSKRDL